MGRSKRCHALTPSLAPVCRELSSALKQLAEIFGLPPTDDTLLIQAGTELLSLEDLATKTVSTIVKRGQAATSRACACGRLPADMRRRAQDGTTVVELVSAANWGASPSPPAEPEATTSRAAQLRERALGLRAAREKPPQPSPSPRAEETGEDKTSALPGSEKQRRQKRAGGRRRYSVALQSPVMLDNVVQEVTAEEQEPEQKDEGVEMLSVECPEGVVPGDTLFIQTPDGEELEIVVPEGMAPGDSFDVAVAAGGPEEEQDGAAAGAEPGAHATGETLSVECPEGVGLAPDETVILLTPPRHPY